jgi:RNA polymerase-associated protein LEO1
MSDSEDPIDLVDEGGDDLFGDDDDAITSPQERVLDDDDLPSDREGEGYNRYRDEEEAPIHGEEGEKTVMAIRTYRHRIPKPQNGSVCTRARQSSRQGLLT